MRSIIFTITERQLTEAETAALKAETPTGHRFPPAKFAVSATGFTTAHFAEPTVAPEGVLILAGSILAAIGIKMEDAQALLKNAISESILEHRASATAEAIVDKLNQA